MTSAVRSSDYKLALIDMDGTLLNNSHKLSDYTKESLRNLVKLNKCKIGIATGRSHISVIDYLNELQLEQSEIPIICFNGSVTYMYSANSSLTLINISQISVELSRELIKLTTEMGLPLQWYNGTTGEVCVKYSDEYSDLVERYGNLVGKPQTIIEDYVTSHKLKKITKLIVNLLAYFLMIVTSLSILLLVKL